MRILVIDIDSLRADHLGCYGYSRETSPTIDRLAADGVVFENCFVSDSPCLPSRTALATGRFGIKNGVVTHHGAGQWYQEPGEGHSQDGDRPLAFWHLANNGLFTASISSFTKRHLAYHFGAGFRETLQPTNHTGHEDGRHVTDAAIDWLDRRGKADDWLLHVNFWEPHQPIRNVDPYVDVVRESGPAAPWPDQTAIDDQQGMTGPRTADCWSEHENAQGWGDDEWPAPRRIQHREDVIGLVDGYDAAIRKVDHHVGELLEALDRIGIRDETMIVLTADHGEAFGEHGLYGTHSLSHRPTQRVPLIVSPGAEQPREPGVRDGLCYQFDLVATLCELVGAEIPSGWDAQSFKDGLESSEFDGREYLVCSGAGSLHSRAIYTQEWTLLRLLNPGPFTYPGMFNDPDLPDGGLTLLHNLEDDPWMTKNLLETFPNQADRLRCHLDRWVGDQSATTDAGGTDRLRKMALEVGPFYYRNMDRLLELYETERSQDQYERLVASIDRFHPTWE